MAFRVPAPDGARGDDNLPLMVLPPDTVLKDGYRLSYFSSGGMSITYTAIKAGEKYLVKEVEAYDSKKVIALNQEKFILERLNHPLIIKVYDLFEYDGFYYMVTEYIEGETMDRLISPFPNTFIQEKVLIHWALQLCDIFEYLHAQKPPVIYRDLKPRNVIKDRSGRIHLIDFGIARAFKQGKSKDTEPMGSAMTASPEHYGGSQTDQRSDIYTIGATIHYLAANGKGSSDEPFVFTPVRSINPKLSESFERVIAKALEVEPARRYHTVVEMRQALLNSREVPLPVLEPFGEHKGGDVKSLDGDTGGEKETHGAINAAVFKVASVAITALVCLLVIFLGMLIVDKIIGDGRDNRTKPVQNGAAIVKIPADTGEAGIPSGSFSPDSVTEPSPSVAATEERSPAVSSQPSSKQPSYHSPQITGSDVHPTVAAATPRLTESIGYPLHTQTRPHRQVNTAYTETPPVLPGGGSLETSTPSFPGEQLRQNIKVIKPEDGIDYSTIRTIKIFRDEKNNYEIFLPVGWIRDKQAVILDSQLGGKALIGFSHIPIPPSSSKPDIFIFLWREGPRAGYQESSQYLEEWVRQDEQNNKILARLRQSPVNIQLYQGRGTALEVVYAPNSNTQFWQTRLVTVDSGGVNYLRGMIARSDEEKRLTNGKTLKECVLEVIKSIKLINL